MLLGRREGGELIGEGQKQSGQIPSGVLGLIECPRLAEVSWGSELPHAPQGLLSCLQGRGTQEPSPTWRFLRVSPVYV